MTFLESAQELRPAETSFYAKLTEGSSSSLMRESNERLILFVRAEP